MTKRKNDIYIDCEWFLDQTIYLFGYAFDEKNCGQLYGTQLTKSKVRLLFKDVKYIYFWGPDIGMLEKFF